MHHTLKCYLHVILIFTQKYYRHHTLKYYVHSSLAHFSILKYYMCGNLYFGGTYKLPPVFSIEMFQNSTCGGLNSLNS